MPFLSFEARAETRFNFTYHFLVGAAKMAELAYEIDKKGASASSEERIQFTSFIAGSIMQSVAALEAEVWNLFNHGPGHHLGSNGVDNVARDMLSIVSSSLEREPLVVKYDLILQLTRRKKLDFGIQPMQDLKLLVALRNEITHYKSLLTSTLDRIGLFKSLEQKDSSPPSFYSKQGMNFFPHICLNFERAKWALETVVSFMDYYYNLLEISCPLNDQDRSLIVL